MNDGTVMRRSKRRKRAEATGTRLRPISTGLLLLAVVVIVAVTWPLTRWLYGIAGDDLARRIEAIKIGLTAAPVTGGALALLLAFRRQRSTEIIATETREAWEREYEQRDRAADASERDAEQRRITELYTKAADQLGCEKAPVRLAGLHALERLAQITPDQRQTIVDVICAYLRMPHTPPDEQPPAEDAPAEAHTRYEQRLQELQVRLTAQRILGAHLRPEAADAFWAGINLNLTQAHLHTLDLTYCHVRAAQFDGAKFAGDAEFVGAHFHGDVRFNEAHFHGDAVFNNAHFHGEALFDEETYFDRSTKFSNAHFARIARFDNAHFCGIFTIFCGARFGEGAVFIGAHFGGRSLFDGAHFSDGDAWFSKAQFSDSATFFDAQFSGQALFDGARVRPHFGDSWPEGWTTRDARTAEGEKEGWMYLVRVEDGGERQPDQEDQSDSETGTSGK